MTDDLTDILEREADAREGDGDRYLAWLDARIEQVLAVRDEGGEGGSDSITLDLRDVPARDFLTRADITGELDGVDLLSLDLPPVRMLVDGLLPEGTTVLAAPPKIGKSVLCYQLAVECALGGEFLGRRAQEGAVLYLALEDGKRRGQDRLRGALTGRRLPRGRLTVRWDSPAIGDGLEEMLDEWLSRHVDAVLVIIDTLGKVRKGSDGRRNAYEVDVEDLGRLQNLFRDRPGLGLLIVHHTAKRTDYDFVSAVSGTYGIPGSADTIITIKRQRLVEVATLDITGREIAECELAVRYVNMRWEPADDALPGMTPERHAILEGIRTYGPIQATALGRELRLGRGAVQYHIENLVHEGYISKILGGYVVSTTNRVESG